MRVRELMSAPAFTCRPTDSLETAARLMWEHDCGVIPVVDGDGRVQAAITDRDICMGAYTRGARLSELDVGGTMSHDLVTCRPDDDLTVAVRKMTEAAVRRLPVVEGDGRVRGMLSLNDIALAGERNAGAATEAMRVLLASCRHIHGTAPQASTARSSQAVAPS